DIFRDVVPVTAAIARVPEFAVVGSRPDQAFLDRRRSDGVDDFAVKLAKIVLDDAAGGNDAAGVLGRKIGTDDAPTLSAGGSLEDHLAAEVDGVVIERIDGERRSPVA